MILIATTSSTTLWSLCCVGSRRSWVDDDDDRGLASPHVLDAEARIRDFNETGRFEPVHHEVIAWTGRHTAGELRALFASYSPWLALPPERRSAALDALEHLALDRFGGIVERALPDAAVHRCQDELTRQPTLTGRG